MKMMLTALAFCIALIAPAHAQRDIGSQWDSVEQIYPTRHNQRATRVRNYSSGQILPHPPGCPRRAFCGCGAALEVFGKHVRELWLARNWFKFPRTAAAPGMVAVRRHHVYVIKQVLGNGQVLAYDANSGGGRTRLHQRSLSGYTVVNPIGVHYAAAR